MADSDKTYTQAELDAAIQERLAAAKAEGDKAFQSLWDEAKQAKAARKELEAKLADIEVAQKAQKAGVTSEELNRLRSEIREDLEKGEYGQFRTQAEKLAGENRALKLDNVVKAAMAKGGARADRIDALFRLTSDRYDLTDDGKPMLRDRMGTPIEKYVSDDLLKEYPEFFNGSGASGGGAAKSGAGGVGGGVVSDGAGFMANLKDIASGKTQVLVP